MYKTDYLINDESEEILSHLLITKNEQAVFNVQTGIKGALSDLKQLLATEKWWKMFLFHLKWSFCSQDIQIFVLTSWSCSKTAWLETSD